MSGLLTGVLDEIRAAQPGAEIWRGTIAKTATTVTARLTVTIPAYSADLQLPVGCRWQPRFAPFTVNLAEPGEADRNVELAHVIYPQKGDDCLVAFDENDDPWVITYWPASYA